MTDALTRQIIEHNQNKDKSPHVCPVCVGRGFVRGGFYQSTDSTALIHSTTEICRTCNGEGVLWR